MTVGRVGELVDEGGGDAGAVGEGGADGGDGGEFVADRVVDVGAVDGAAGVMGGRVRARGRVGLPA
ncbi:MAG: hypothetical protein ACPHFO_03240 [Acidimicrobiales bacterium]